MKSFFPISNHKILYFAILIICRKNLSQSGCTDCKIMTNKGEEKALLVGCLDNCQCLEFHLIFVGICQNLRMGSSCGQDSKSKVS
jgi:hypothetical protein